MLGKIRSLSACGLLIRLDYFLRRRAKRTYLYGEPIGRNFFTQSLLDFELRAVFLRNDVVSFSRKFFFGFASLFGRY